MDLSLHAVTKPNYPRRKPKQGNLSKITPNVRKEVLRRSECKCERCERTQAFCFEMAHLLSAGQGGRGDQPWNIALLCGPSVDSGTCHHFADHTAKGREWRKQKREQLKKLYKVGEHSD